MIALGVARSGLALYRWPTASDSPSDVAVEAPMLMLKAPPPPVARPGLIEVDSQPFEEMEAMAASGESHAAPIAIEAIQGPASEVAAPPDGRRAWAGAIVGAWGVGLLWLSARLARGIASLAALRRRARPIADGPVGAVFDEVRRALGTRRRPPILEAGGIPGPLAGGVFRPIVVLPIGMAEAPGAAGLRDVLIHECAHVARLDPLVGLLQRVAAAVFWPHPLVHRLNGELARAREEACDDAVLRAGDPCGYARTLLRLAEGGGAAGRAAAVVGLFETRWGLAERVARILDRGRQPDVKTSRWFLFAGVAVLALAGAAVAAIRPGEPTRVEAQVPARPALPDDGTGSVIEGQVVDEAGTPVAGASVNVTWFRKAKEDAKTGADGRFTLAIPGPVRQAELARASIDDDARIGLARREEPHRSGSEPVRIVLKPSRAATVRVADAAGRAVAGAAVEVQGFTGGPIAQGATDEAGVARFRLPVDAEVDAVVALKDGVGANPMPYAITRGDVEALVRAIGRDPATPEVIAEVGLVVRPQENWTTDLDPLRRAATDPRFVALADKASTALLGKPAGTASLVYLAPFHRPGVGEADLRRLLATWPAIKPGKPVRGVVEDSATCRPVAGATVFNAVGLTTTNAKGEFTLAASIRRSLWVEAGGYALAEATPSADPVKVALVKEEPIVGRVLDREGLKPVEGAMVWAMVNHSHFQIGADRGKKDSYGFPLSARTDAQGRFAFRGMPPGVGLDWFEVQHPRFQLVSRAERSLKADKANDIPVEAGCVVSGEVVDEAGRGVAGASVILRIFGEWNMMVRHYVITEADGRYHFANVAPGRYGMLVEPERQAFRSIAVVADRNRPAINQVVVEAGSTISGKVVDFAGSPIADAAVGWPTLLDGSGMPDEASELNRQAYTGADGTFQIVGLAPGKYQLTAVAGPPDRRAKVDAKANQADLVITLPGVGR